MLHSKAFLFALLAAAASLPAAAQEGSQAQALPSTDPLSQISVFNFREGSKSDLFLRGTPIAPNANGEVDVEFEDGNARITADVEDLPEASSLGPYTTYVLWALTPDGRAQNQGVVAGLSGGKGSLDTTYNSSQFALIVTAEPDFAVTLPSRMVVLYNAPDKVEGTESKLTATVEHADYSKLEPIAMEKDTPVALVQARYAVEIAEQAGAARYAPEAFSNAEEKLSAAEAAQSGDRKERKSAPDLARVAVVAGEDARRAALAGAVAAAEAVRTEEAESRAAAAAAEEEQRRAAEAAAQDLEARLNAALPTRETPKGLVSNIGGAHFATGSAELDVAAREGLAKFSGVVASYPGLRFEVDGYTDNTGDEATNRELSLRRAIAVRDYLVSQGVPASAIDVNGFGPSNPIASNATAAGRAENRRVEIVVSGGPLSVETEGRG
jgi:outer membrane protein OmpA-like peptidoglycan-associated protein